MVKVNKEKTIKNIADIIYKYPNVIACAVDMGVMPCTVYKWLKGEWFPRVDILVKLAHVAGKTLDDIVVVESEK